MVMCKVDKFEGKNDDISRRKYAIDCKFVSNFFPRGLSMEGNGKIIVVRGHKRSAKFSLQETFLQK